MFLGCLKPILSLKSLPKYLQIILINILPRLMKLIGYELLFQLPLYEKFLFLLKTFQSMRKNSCLSSSSSAETTLKNTHQCRIFTVSLQKSKRYLFSHQRKPKNSGLTEVTVLRIFTTIYFSSSETVSEKKHQK